MSVVVVLELGPSAGASSVLHMSAELTNLPPHDYRSGGYIHTQYRMAYTSEGKRLEKALEPIEQHIQYGRNSIRLSPQVVDSTILWDILEEILILFGYELSFATIIGDAHTIQPQLVRNPDRHQLQSNITRMRTEMIRRRNRLIVEATQRSIDDARGASVASK